MIRLAWPGLAGPWPRLSSIVRPCASQLGVVCLLRTARRGLGRWRRLGCNSPRNECMRWSARCTRRPTRNLAWQPARRLPALPIGRPPFCSPVLCTPPRRTTASLSGASGAATLQSLDRHKAARGCPQVMETPPSGRVVCAPGIRLCHLQSPGALASRPPLWAIARVPQTQVPGCERSPRRLLIPDLPSPRPCPESVMRRVEAGQSPSLVAPAPREPLLDLARRLITAARGEATDGEAL